MSVAAYSEETLQPTTASVVIGAVTGTFGGYESTTPHLTLGGTATGNTIGSIQIQGSSLYGQPVVQVNSGVWTFTGSSTYTAPMIIAGGEVNLNFGAASSPTSNIIPSGGTVTLGGGRLVLTGSPGASNSQTDAVTNVGTYTNTYGVVVQANGSSSVVLNSNGASALSLNLGAISRTIGSTLDISQPSGTLSAINGVLTSSGVASTILTANGVAYATIGGSDWAAMDASNTFLVGLSTLGGYTQSTSASLAGNADVASGVTTTTLAGNTAVTSLRFNQNQATALNLGGNVLTTGGILVTPAVATAGSTIGNGTLEGAAGQDLVVIQNSSQPLTIGASIADNTAATGLTKAGAGAVVLSGTNTYSGPTYVNAGTLQFATPAALGPSSVTVNGATLALNVGGPGEFNAANSGSGSLGNVLSTTTWNAGSTISIDTSNAVGALTYGQAIAGSSAAQTANLGLAKLGTGTLVLSTASNYGGGTTIIGGTLQYGTYNALPTAGAVQVSGGVLDLNQYGGSVGAVTLVNGMITGSSISSLTATSYAVQNGTVSAELAGNSAALTKTTTGTVVLSGDNTYNGGTTVSGGTLQLDSPSALGTGGLVANAGTVDLNGFSLTTTANNALPSLAGTAGTITDNSGGGATTLTVSQSATTTFGGTIKDGPSNQLALELTGPGTLTLSGSNPFTGGTTVSDGTLIVTHSTGLADGSSLTVGDPTQFGSGGAVASPSVAAVPEPGVLALLAVGLGVGFGVRRRRKGH